MNDPLPDDELALAGEMRKFRQYVQLCSSRLPSKRLLKIYLTVSFCNVCCTNVDGFKLSMLLDKLSSEHNR